MITFPILPPTIQFTHEINLAIHDCFAWNAIGKNSRSADVKMARWYLTSEGFMLKLFMLTLEILPLGVIVDENIVFHGQFKIRDFFTHPSRLGQRHGYANAYQTQQTE